MKRRGFLAAVAGGALAAVAAPAVQPEALLKVGDVIGITGVDGLFKVTQVITSGRFNIRLYPEVVYSYSLKPVKGEANA